MEIVAISSNPQIILCKTCSSEFLSLRINHTRCSKTCKDRSWYLDNTEHKKAETTAYHKSRPLIDERFRLARNLRKRLRAALKFNSKTGSAVEDLGCSIDDLKIYLESKFDSEMSWKNYGPKGWHIDHIKPLSKFDLTDTKELKKACHYTNLQPMWWKENLRKSNG